MTGEYDDFTVGWYKNVGPSVCTTMVMQIIVPQMRNGFPFLIASIKRFVDRGCSSKA